MKKIFLCCAMGASSSIFEAKVRQYVKDNNLDVDIIAKSVNDIKTYLKKEQFDCILLAPQVSYHKEQLIEKYPGVKIATISPADYGTMNGGKVIQELYDELNK